MPKGKGSADPSEGFTLQQQEAVERLIGLIRRFSNGGAVHTDEEKYAMFGLFGARGSGKSTILRQVLERLDGGSPGILVCRPPLDCTTLPRHIPLGLSLAAHVKRFLDALCDPDAFAGQAARSRPSRARGKELEEAKESFDGAWQQVVQRYVETDQHHRDLQLSLAVTQSEYQDIAGREIESRADLGHWVQAWIDASLALAGAATGAGRERILVALEDSDLGTGPVSLRVISTFLDELVDERLMFIVVADESNLEERLRKGVHEELSDHMIPQVLSKVVPVHHRVYLDPWNAQQALSFVPLANRRQGQDKALASVLDERLTAAGDDRIPLQTRDLTLLLPRYPRGLSDLYRGLTETGGGKPSRLAARTFDSSALVLLLARARGDLSMARNLPLRPLSWWGLHLRWPDEGSSLGTWGQLIDKAWAGRPLWAFAPLKLPFELRDEEDAVLWAELLLNLSFRFNRESIRTFVRRFSPLAAQLASCSCRFKPTPYELIRMGQMSEDILGSPWFLWRGARRDAAEIEAGWTPIVERSIGQPRSTLAEILKDLGAFVRATDPIAPDENAPDSRLLPADVRSLLLLTDKVSRLPWGDLLSWMEAQFVGSWPPMLALFCGEAYLATLLECLAAEAVAGDSEPEARDSVDMLRKLASEQALAALQDGSAEAAQDGLRQLVRELDARLDWSLVDHPMAEATKAFFASSAVRNLLPPEQRPVPAKKS